MKPTSKNGFHKLSASQSRPQLWKRALDVSCCLFALPALACTTLFVALLTAVTSPGPIFFKQERVGYKGRRFQILKFRTMHATAATTTHQAHFAELVKSNVPMKKLDCTGDSRLIAGGWLLRATGLDELPQIINVLRGDMSVVGPRPCIPYEYEQYSARQRERFASIPGLTGLWQVSGKNRTTFEEMVRLDVEYARTQSFSLDLKIILKTVPALISQVSDVKRAQRASAVKPSFSPSSQLQTVR